MYNVKTKRLLLLLEACWPITKRSEDQNLALLSFFYLRFNLLLILFLLVLAIILNKYCE